MSRWLSHRKLDPWLTYRFKGGVRPARSVNAPPIEWGFSEERTLDILVSLAVPVALKKIKTWPIEQRTFAGAVHKTNAPTEFEKQKEAFKAIPPIFLAPYHGKFVASLDGTIVDCDTDLASLSHRFRARYGKVPVYITRVGKKAKMPTPFVR